MVLGEGTTAFATDGTSVVSFDQSSGATQWTYQATSGASSILSAHGGGLTVLDGQWNQLALDPTGIAGTPTAGQASATPLRLGLWAGLVGGGIAGFSGLKAVLAPSAWPAEGGSLPGTKAPPKLTIQTFWPTIISADPLHDVRFGSDAKAFQDLQSQIPAAKVIQTIFMTTTPPKTRSTVNNFITQILSNQLDVVGFVGHATVITSAPNFANGLQLSDNLLQRLPDCTNPSSIFCYNTIPGADLTNPLLTSAQIVFVAACDTNAVFTTWWDLTPSSAPNGGALVVPDLVKMAQNAGLQQVGVGDVDLVQGAIGWEAFVTSIAKGNTAQVAVNDANKAIANIYPALVYPPGTPKPVQVIFTALGNPQVCPRCSNHP
jgi:hypothetical protein